MSPALTAFPKPYIVGDEGSRRPPAERDEVLYLMLEWFEVLRPMPRRLDVVAVTDDDRVRQRELHGGKVRLVRQ